MTPDPSICTPDHFVDLTLAILGVIQGLAFSHLAEKLPRRNKEYGWLDQALVYAVYTACVLIVIRVFQTYALAAIDKTTAPELAFPDLVAMFVVGLLQYWIFDEIGKYKSNVREIFRRIVVLAIAAILLHLRTAWRIDHAAKPNMDDLVIEVWNISFAFMIAVFAVFGGYWTVAGGRFRLAMAVLISASLAFNIAHSLS